MLCNGDVLGLHDVIKYKLYSKKVTNENVLADSSVYVAIKNTNEKKIV